MYHLLESYHLLNPALCIFPCICVSVCATISKISFLVSDFIFGGNVPSDPGMETFYFEK